MYEVEERLGTALRQTTLVVVRRQAKGVKKLIRLALVAA